MEKDEVEAELVRLADILGGGWHWGNHSAIPIATITLTLPEAEHLEHRLKRLEGPDGTDSEVSLLFNLLRAHIHAQRALDALYHPNGPKRNIFYRMAVGRAQNILISLYVREMARKGK